MRTKNLLLLILFINLLSFPSFILADNSFYGSNKYYARVEYMEYTTAFSDHYDDPLRINFEIFIKAEDGSWISKGEYEDNTHIEDVTETFSPNAQIGNSAVGWYGTKYTNRYAMKIVITIAYDDGFWAWQNNEVTKTVYYSNIIDISDGPFWDSSQTYLVSNSVTVRIRFYASA